jgi:signal transduction histidine kinase
VEAPEERLPEPVETAAYYICSEALANASKHAAATTASVSVARAGPCVRIEIQDDGRGGADPAGTGIVGLRDRAEALGGSLTVVSPPGRGTTIVAALPFGS